MPAVSPKSVVHDLPPVPRVALETSELSVPDGLEEESDDPDDRPGQVEKAHGMGRGADRCIDEDHGIADDQKKKSLEQEDLEVAPDDERAPPLRAPSGIAGVFAALPVPEQNMEGQPYPPDEDEA
jgi:hypothetical protein